MKNEGYPSLYETYEIDEDKKTMSPMCQGFLLVGPLACVNSDKSIDIKVANRHMETGHLQLLKWEINFECVTVNFQSDKMEGWCQVTYRVNYEEVRVERDEIEANLKTIIGSRSDNHSMSGVKDHFKLTQYAHSESYLVLGVMMYWLILLMLKMSKSLLITTLTNLVWTFNILLTNQQQI